MQIKEDSSESMNIYKVINNASEFQDLVNSLIRLSRLEINSIFYTSNAFLRQKKAGADEILVEVVKKYDVKARLLVPMDKNIRIIADNYKTQNLNIDIKHIESNHISFAIIDRKHVFIAEIGDDSKDNSFEAISRMIYTNSPSTVSFYASIFDSFWEQAKLYEKTKKELDQTRLEMSQMRYYVDELMDEMSILKRSNKMSAYS